MTALAVPGPTRTIVYERDWHACVRCGRGLGEGNRQLQHRDARGMGGGRNAHRLSNLVLLCGFSATDPAGCHHAVEDNPDQARIDGYRVPMGIDPAEHPILWHGRWAMLDDLGDVHWTAT